MIHVLHFDTKMLNTHTSVEKCINTWIPGALDWAWKIQMYDLLESEVVSIIEFAGLVQPTYIRAVRVTNSHEWDLEIRFLHWEESRVQVIC